MTVTVAALSSGTIAALVAIFVIDLFAVLLGLSFLRARKIKRRTDAAERAGMVGMPSREQAAKAPPRPVSRRQFFRRSLLVSFGIFGLQFGAGTIAFLWPNLGGGFGSVIAAGNIDDIKAEIEATDGQPFYVGTGRFYLVPYDGSPEGDVDYATEGVTTDGIMPLYQRCVHLGCRVPFCAQSKWFECPCHGSKYNEAGEYQLGPAPRGMDRFQIEVAEDGTVSVDTSVVLLGPPRGTDTIQQPPQGSFCVAPG